MKSKQVWMKSSPAASDEIKSATPRVSGISSLQRFHPRQWIYSALADLVKKDLGIILGLFFGADYGARTRHLHLGKVALYQMS